MKLSIVFFLRDLFFSDSRIDRRKAISLSLELIREVALAELEGNEISRKIYKWKFKSAYKEARKEQISKKIGGNFFFVFV